MDQKTKKQNKAIELNSFGIQKDFSDHTIHAAYSTNLSCIELKKAVDLLTKIYQAKIAIMNRLDVIQQIINHKQANTYLEIGVKKGKAFLEIRARKKIAIDPLFKISMKRKIKFFLNR